METLLEKNKQSVLAAIYARVSSEKQERDGNIDSQVQELEKAVLANGDIIAKRYLDDGYSGELLERPGLDELRNDASKEIYKKVYFLSPDRLARKNYYAQIVLEDLQNNGIETVFINRPLGDSPEDKLLFNIQSVFADYEKAKIADRMRRGKLFKLKSGSVLGNTAPYGYRCIKDPVNKKAWYEINEEEADVVRFIFAYYTSGECSGLGGVRKELYRRGIKSRKSKSDKWSQSMVARILSNESYIGTTHWGKFKSVEGKNSIGYKRLKNNLRVKRPKDEWFPISVPSIISASLFAKTVQVRAQNKSISPNTAKYNYLLRGIGRCVCGFPLYSKMSHQTPYYLCSKNRFEVPGQRIKCENAKHFRGETIDDAVWNEFCKIALSPEILMHRIEEKRSNKGKDQAAIGGQIVAINKKLAAIQAKRERLIKLYTDEVITLDEFKNQTADMQKQLDVLAAERIAYQSKISETQVEIPSDKILKEFSEQMRGLIKNADFSLKQRLIRMFLKEVLVKPNEAIATGFLPADLLDSVPTSMDSI